MRKDHGIENDEAQLIWAVFRLARRLRQPLGSGDLIGSGLGLLASLHREGTMSAATLARREGLKPQSVSLVLARLEREGLIQRQRNPSDRRQHQLVLTDAGVIALRRATCLRREWLANVLNTLLVEEDRKTLVASSELMLKIADYNQD